MSLLFYGIPGTGKSELVYYLGHTLGKEVVLRRCSEIQSKWVGETEKNIAAAFAEAQEENKILFFDEADSFLYPRKEASASWEKSFTNEILTQLESYAGIVVFATNDMEGLDHASLRRFRFKVEFRPLTPEGCLELYNTVLQPLLDASSCLSEEDTQRIRGISNLTPGDFAVVRDQFMFAESGQITHSQLIEALVSEVRYKHQGREVIGFRRCA